MGRHTKSRPRYLANGYFYESCERPSCCVISQCDSLMVVEQGWKLGQRQSCPQSSLLIITMLGCSCFFWCTCNFGLFGARVCFAWLRERRWHLLRSVLRSTVDGAREGDSGGDGGWGSR